MRQITVVGSINVDLVVHAARLPRAGETVLGRDFRVVCGGKGANQAVAAARFGGRVELVGCVGADEYGRIARENLERAGVDVRGVKPAGAKAGRSPSPHASTGVALIVVDDAGRNLIAVAPNANARVQVPRRQLDIAVMQLETPWRLPRARTVVLNPAPSNPDVLLRARGRRPLAGIDFIIPNEHEAEHLTGERGAAKAHRALLKLGARQAIITLGQRGVYDGVFRQGFRVKALDTVGAGDTFIGALAAALAAERRDPVRFAQAAAALKCTRRGAQNLPSRAAVERLLASSGTA